MARAPGEPAKSGTLALPAPGEAHVWHIGLDVPADTLGAVVDLLSPAERARARRCRRDQDRRRFMAARGALRSILASYLGIAPATIVFTHGPHGKPGLPGAQNGPDLRFSLSHSGERALVAVTRSADVGVDIECARENLDALSVARRFFAPDEAAALVALPESDRRAAFLTVWTRKEAAAKASGTGIAGWLDRPPDPRWALKDIDCPPGYTGCLAVEGGALRIVSHEWAPPLARMRA